MISSGGLSNGLSTDLSQATGPADHLSCPLPAADGSKHLFCQVVLEEEEETKKCSERA